MPSLNWKSVLTATLIVALGATSALYYLNHVSTAPEAPSIDQDATAIKKKKKKSKSKKSGTASASSSQDSIVSDINTAKVSVEKSLNDLSQMIELDSEQIALLSVDDRQKVFYALLMKGEALMNQGSPEFISQAVGYFTKALAIVPNPSEILAAFEKTLPPSVFDQLITSLKAEVQQKTTQYFDSLTSPTEGAIKFSPVEEADILGKVSIRYAPIAAKPIDKGIILFEEKPDVVSFVEPTADLTKHCEYCLDLAGEFKCEKHDDAVYCSAECQKIGFDLYHMYACKARPEAHAKIEALREYCQDVAHSGLGLLMLKYISMLLTEEMRGNGASSNGPFMHYDHLPQMFPSPSDVEKHEAELIRAIFTTANENMADFLNDQVYASMKATLHRACFAFAVDNPEAINNTTHVEAFRKVIGDNQDCDVMALYHLAAHLPHSCSPNVALELVPHSGCKIRAIALRDIKPGEHLNIAFVPVADMEKEMRKEKLFLNFMLDCQCTECSA